MSTQAGLGRFGELDGEEINFMAVKFKGAAGLDRMPSEGERMVLTVEATTAPHVIKRVNGQLVREVTLEVRTLAEPAEDMAEEVADFLKRVSDEAGGTPGLPFPPKPPKDEGDAEE